MAFYNVYIKDFKGKTWYRIAVPDAELDLLVKSFLEGKEEFRLKGTLINIKKPQSFQIYTINEDTFTKTQEGCEKYITKYRETVLRRKFTPSDFKNFGTNVTFKFLQGKEWGELTAHNDSKKTKMITAKEKNDFINALCSQIKPNSHYNMTKPDEDGKMILLDLKDKGFLDELSINSQNMFLQANIRLFNFRDAGGYPEPTLKEIVLKTIDFLKTQNGHVDVATLYFKNILKLNEELHSVIRDVLLKNELVNIGTSNFHLKLTAKGLLLKPHQIDDFGELIAVKNEEKESVNMKAGKIFISHSTLDKDIVNQFISLILSNALHINTKQDVFCTSFAGSKPLNGEDFRQRIKDELLNAKLVLQFISKNYKKSEVCLNEMGASWVLKGIVIPLIVEKDNYEVGFIHSTTQQSQLHKKEDLLKLVDDLKQYGVISDFSSNLVNNKVDEFLAFINSLESKSTDTKKFTLKIEPEHDSPFFIINNRKNWYFKDNGKYREIPDELTKCYLGYRKSQTKVNSIELNSPDSMLDLGQPMTSITNCEFLSPISNDTIWLVFDNKRHHVANGYTFELFRKHIEANKLNLKHSVVSDSQILGISQGDPLDFQGLI